MEEKQEDLIQEDKQLEEEESQQENMGSPKKQPIYRAMQIYEPWMEPDYYKKKEKKVKPQPEQEAPIEPVTVTKERPVTVGLAGGGRPPTRMLTPIEDVPLDDDPTEFVEWVMNGRMDDFGDVKKKLFKNEKDWN